LVNILSLSYAHPVPARGQTKVMPALVTPELTVYDIADKEALNSYAKARTAAGSRVNFALKANLEQLLEFDKVGTDRSKRWEAADGIIK